MTSEDDAPTTGTRFLGASQTDERIVRSEYRWGMWGGNWQIDLEAAYNRLEQTSQLFDLNPTGEFAPLSCRTAAARSRKTVTR